MTPHGHFHWNELMTRDIAAAKTFYGEVLGWTFEDTPMPDGMYTICMADGEAAAGMFDISGLDAYAEMPASWFTYIAVDDVDARVEKAVASGATLIQPAFDVPDVGRFAMLQQPDGAMIGWITPAPMPG